MAGSGQAAHLSLGGNHRGACCPHLSVSRGSNGCHTALPLCAWSDLGRVQLGGQHERAVRRRQQLGAQRRQQLPQGGQLRLHVRRQTASLQMGTSCQPFLQHPCKCAAPVSQPCRRVSPAPLQTGTAPARLGSGTPATSSRWPAHQEGLVNANALTTQASICRGHKQRTQNRACTLQLCRSPQTKPWHRPWPICMQLSQITIQLKGSCCGHQSLQL